ncbi:MAG TPA: hypothetical protein VF941_02955 [Clostridia bacterium]
MGFFTLGFFIGKSLKKTVVIFDKETNTQEEKEVPISTSEDDILKVAGYPKNGIRYQPVDEPAGIVYRPTAEELKLMGEDEVTKESKKAMAETFGGKV